MNFYSMLVDTMWSVVSMSVVISMRGRATPAVAIALYLLRGITHVAIRILQFAPVLDLFLTRFVPRSRYEQLEQLNERVGNLLSVNDLCAQVRNATFCAIHI